MRHLTFKKTTIRLVKRKRKAQKVAFYHPVVNLKAKISDLMFQTSSDFLSLRGKANPFSMILL